RRSALRASGSRARSGRRAYRPPTALRRRLRLRQGDTLRVRADESRRADHDGEDQADPRWPMARVIVVYERDQREEEEQEREAYRDHCGRDAAQVKLDAAEPQSFPNQQRHNEE